MYKKITLLLALLLIFGLVSCSGGNSQSKADTPSDNASIDSKFIFSAYDTKGTKRSTDEWIGKKGVIINFWGTWCPPCRMEIPDLVKLYKEYRSQNIEIIGVALNDKPYQVEQFAASNGMDWVMLIGDVEIAKKFEISSVPTTIFVDKDGNVMPVFDPVLQGVAPQFRGAKNYETFKKAFEELANKVN